MCVCVSTHLKAGCKEDAARLFSAVTSARSNRQKLEHRRFPLETLFHCQGDRAQVAQRGSGVYILKTPQSHLHMVLRNGL